LSAVQTSPSLQLMGVPALQRPSEPHLSPVVQPSPSLQLAPVRATCVQPVAASHASVVHSSSSSQSSSPPALQLVPEQTSWPLHLLPSLQGVLAGAATVSQTNLSGTQTPTLHASETVQSAHSASAVPHAAAEVPRWQTRPAFVFSKQPEVQQALPAQIPLPTSATAHREPSAAPAVTSLHVVPEQSHSPHSLFGGHPPLTLQMSWA
jgi:hypothetical protein